MAYNQKPELLNHKIYDVPCICQGERQDGLLRREQELGDLQDQVKNSSALTMKERVQALLAINAQLVDVNGELVKLLKLDDERFLPEGHKQDNEIRITLVRELESMDNYPEGLPEWGEDGKQIMKPELPQPIKPELPPVYERKKLPWQCGDPIPEDQLEPT